MTRYTLFILVCLPLCVVMRSLEKDRNEKFDFLLLAQFWPATSCLYFEKVGCIVPEEVKGWTIHGLWPSVPGHDQPEECNKSMPFNYTEIQSLRPELDLKWPYYNKSATDRKYLWEHEWEKHGTCAYPLPPLKGEMRYFTRTLDLYSNLNPSISEALEKFGIKPSETIQYKPDDIFKAIKTAYGKIPNIACYFDKETHQSHLEQVWLCFDKQLNPRDCEPVEITRSKIRKFNKQTHGRHEEDQALRFQSEKGYTGSKTHTYFSDCPTHNKTVHFLPIKYSFVVEKEEVVYIEREYYEKAVRP